MAEKHKRRVRSDRIGSAATRERLITAALACVRTRGLAGSTSREIATEAGVNLEAITYHFGSKDDLIAEALTRAIQRWLAPALDELRRDAAPTTRMLAAASAFRTAFDSARDILPAYFEAVVAAPRAPVVHQRLTLLLGELRDFLSGEIEALRSLGFLPQWVEPASLATLLIAMLDGIALHAVISPDAVNPDALLAQAVQVLMAIQRAPGAPP